MYYSISKSRGSFYLSSKDPREGYEKVIYGKDNNVTFHKYLPNVQGVLQKVAIEQKQMRGAEFSFLVVEFLNANSNYTDTLSCVLKEYGRFTESAKALTSCLAGAVFGEEYLFTCRTRKSEDGERSFLNIYMNSTNKLDENQKPLSTGFIKNADIPKGVVTTDELGQKSTDYTEQNKFYNSAIAAILKKSSEFTPTQRPQAERPPSVPNNSTSDTLITIQPSSSNPLDEFLRSAIS